MTEPTARTPSAAELLRNAAVIAAMEGAWRDSLVGDSIGRHEEGGWIYLEIATAAIVTRRAPAGTRSRLSLANPPLLPGHVIVGTFHTHPNLASEGWTTGPSNQDILAAEYSGVPWLVRAEDGNYHAGPDRRRGGIAGGPGYPLNN
jgi:hypothetical protein